jgi:predicted ATPase
LATENGHRLAPFVRSVALKNYRSIAACDVPLKALTFLIGPNGAGKSNFLDSLRFVSDSLRTSLDHALRDRGGITEVRRRSGGHPTNFGVRIDFQMRSGAEGFYAFQIAATKGRGFQVQREKCEIVGSDLHSRRAWFDVHDGVVSSSETSAMPAVLRDRLYLVATSGLPAFRPVYDDLSRMGFYKLNPDEIRDLQPPEPGMLLRRDGSNLASVLGHLSNTRLDVKQRVEEYLSKIVEGVEGVDREVIGPRETLVFRQRVLGAEYPWKFAAANMSDGTLRALGILVALFQRQNGDGAPLVGIEEPEVALHPAAVGVLLDALRDASRDTQVVVTSHSPDLLDSSEIATDEILAVVAKEGATQIGPLDAAGRGALHDGLYTPGELLRLNQLAPDPKARTNYDQLELFDRFSLD